MKTHLNLVLHRLPLLAVLLLAACSSGAGLNPTTQSGVTRPAANVVATSPPAATTLAAVTGAPAESTLQPAASSTAKPSQAAPTPAATLTPVAPALPCTAQQALTPALTEGPFFKAGSPLRTSLVDAGIGGVRLTLTGAVLTADCKPVSGALLDFWQADSQGHYDNSGYALRGHQLTGAGGTYRLETIVPGLYPGRTEHIHVKVQAPGGPVLTTQLFFPGVAGNQADSIYLPGLLVTLQAGGSPLQASFNFIINTH